MLSSNSRRGLYRICSRKLKSYKHMPATVYQIGEKYRNEIRTRGYLLRGRSFLMMDAYSFDTDLKGLEKSYENVRNAYIKIGKMLGIELLPVIANNGANGWKKERRIYASITYWRRYNPI